ncbi:MAG: zinc ribbon domain-containing protein [Archaeoglobaceae archaeon]
MPKCPKCGESVSSTWRYCRACGANLLGYRRRNYALTMFGLVFILVGLFTPLDSGAMDKIVLYSMGIVLMFFGIVLELFRNRQEKNIKKPKKT